MSQVWGNDQKSRQTPPAQKTKQAILGVFKRIEFDLARTHCDCGCLVVGSVPEIRDHEPRANAGDFAVALNGMQPSEIAFVAMSESL